jgi:hypothetical protein
LRTPIRWQITGVVGAGVLGLPFLRLFSAAPPTPLLKMLDPAPAPVPLSLSQAALHESAFWRVRAVQLADDECDDARAVLQAWDPAATFHQQEARRQLLAGDHAGYLRRARRSAQRAAALARTTRELQHAERELREVEEGAGFSPSTSSRYSPARML